MLGRTRLARVRSLSHHPSRVPSRLNSRETDLTDEDLDTLAGILAAAFSDAIQRQREAKKHKEPVGQG